jgi:plastocyanin
MIIRVFVAIVIVALSLGTWACGSSNYAGSPVTPTPSQTPAPTSTSVVTINVIGVNGAQSFSPNPATLPAGQMVVWHNIDSITHRVVLNDGSLDTGNLDPGASSRPMTINVPAAGDPYHCSIHPVMVGTIVTATTSTVGF